MKKLILIWVIVVILAFVGWIKCIVKFIKCDFNAPYKAEILYGVGTFTGAGVVIGWFDVKDTPKEAVIIKDNE